MHNPVSVVPVLKSEVRGEEAYITEEDFYKLAGMLDDRVKDYMKPLLITMYFTGMRVEECINLKWDRVDLKAGFIRLKPEDTKTKEGRSVPLNPLLTKMLGETNVRYIKHDYVLTRNGEYISPLGSIKEDFRKARDEAKIDDFRFHDLRHTFASILIDLGENPKYIQNQMGHSSIKITFDTYGHLMNTVNKEAANRLGNAIFGGDGSKMVAINEKGVSHIS